MKELTAMLMACLLIVPISIAASIEPPSEGKDPLIQWQEIPELRRLQELAKDHQTLQSMTPAQILNEVGVEEDVITYLAFCGPGAIIIVSVLTDHEEMCVSKPAACNANAMIVVLMVASNDNLLCTAFGDPAFACNTNLVVVEIQIASTGNSACGTPQASWGETCLNNDVHMALSVASSPDSLFCGDFSQGIAVNPIL